MCEGVEDKMISGDVLFNCKMFYLFKIVFFSVQINIEEYVDVVDQEVILWDYKIFEDILKEVIIFKEVLVESVIVWIDLFDVIQEYIEDF